MSGTSLKGSEISEAASRLLTAHETHTPCAPVRDLIGFGDEAAAYAVQRDLTLRRSKKGARVVGRKIGLTSPSVQKQLGVDQPDFGVLFDDMTYRGGDTIPFEAVLQPRVEAEVAFMLGADLLDEGFDAAQLRDSVAYAVAAVEVCGSRIQGWDISFGDTVADNASSGVYVLGPARQRLNTFEPRDVAMKLWINGELASTGAGTECLGDPLEALAWLARKSVELGEPLRAGQVVLSGALGPMCAVSPGDYVKATLSGLGSVAVRFAEVEV